MGFGADLDGEQGMYMRKHVIEMAQRGLVENLKPLKPLMTPTTAKVGSRLPPGTLCIYLIYTALHPTPRNHAQMVACACESLTCGIRCSKEVGEVIKTAQSIAFQSSCSSTVHSAAV